MKIKVLKIEPEKAPQVIEVENSLNGLRTAIGCEYIEAVYPFDDTVAIVCDEDGKLNGSLPNRVLAARGHAYDILFGDFLVTGIGEEDFCGLTDVLCKKFTKLFSRVVVEVRG